jgi:aminopeptidase N
VKRFMPLDQIHRRWAYLILVCLLLLVPLMSSPASATLVHHDIQVRVEPARGWLKVIDEIQLPPDTPASIEFTLRRNLNVTAEGANLKTLETSDRNHIQHYQLTNLPTNRKIRLSYQGEINTEQPQGIFGMPNAVLSQDGIYLDGASAWRPHFRDYPWLTFTLQVQAPQGWEIVSQGKRERLKDGFHYVMPKPQDDIYLLGGRFQRYQKRQNDTELEVYLLDADDELAQRYLQASAEYVQYYSTLIGPYPYAKFAVVENRWQTGYGMPSFTLLGSRVIRLPFILHTSLPHEILHNWWGNGVYIDYSRGNWSEGLTAYLSDHLDSERRGEDTTYRRKALERYANFAARERDFPLSDFRARHNEASQAVGYSKSLMVFHMLRQLAGDVQFNQHIQQFWQRYQFKPASYPDVIEILFSGDKSARETFIEQWLNRPGAPKLALGEVQVEQHGKGFRLSVEINQTQPDAPYRLQVPLEVRLSDSKTPERQVIELTGRRTVTSLDFASRPVTLTLDPTYDVFRLLDPAETPSSLGRLFGARKQLLVVPTGIAPVQRQAWEKLAAAWSAQYQNVELVDDSTLTQLPPDAAVWLLGWENKLLTNHQARFNAVTQQLSSSGAKINGRLLNTTEYAVVLLDPDNSRSLLGFIGAEQPEAITALARKLPHYSGYGRLAFALPEVNNIIKQSLPVTVSPLSRQLGP